MGDVKADIVSEACARIGKDIYIANLDTDTSAEAKALRFAYERTKRWLLARAPWAFAIRRFVPLPDEDLARTGWQYAYPLPGEVVHVLEIVTGRRRDHADRRVQFTIEGDDANGLLLLTDATEPEVKYVADVGEALFDDTFTEALICWLAFRMAQRFKADNEVKKDALQLAAAALDEARAHNAGHEELGPEPESSLTSHNLPLEDD